MSDIALYAVWGETEGIQPGVYRTVWTGQLQCLVERTHAKYRKVDTFEEGYDLIAAGGQDWVRARLPKAQALGNRCWYCARVMDMNSYGESDAAEIEHQVPRCTSWNQVDREENIVVACRRCNNGKHPGKGDRDVQTFRERLQAHEAVDRIVFYGEILRWVHAHAQAMGLPVTGLNP